MSPWMNEALYLRYTQSSTLGREIDMEYWQEFIRHEHANSIMMAVGVLLVFISIMKIIKSSLTMLFWVGLAGLGAASLSYGFEHSPYDLPALDSVSLNDIKSLTPDLDKDVLNLLCQKIDQANGN